MNIFFQPKIKFLIFDRFLFYYTFCHTNLKLLDYSKKSASDLACSLI